MQAAFGTTDVPTICERILRTGALQVSDREREYTSGRLFSSIASIVADKCVDAETNRPIPVGVIERSMKDLLCYSVVPGRPAKAQALEVIRGLAAHMPIERAQMRLDVEAPVKWGKGVKGGLEGLVVGLVGAEEWGGGFRAVRLPGVWENVSGWGGGGAAFEIGVEWSARRRMRATVTCSEGGAVAGKGGGGIAQRQQPPNSQPGSGSTRQACKVASWQSQGHDRPRHRQVGGTGWGDTDPMPLPFLS